MDSRSLWGLPFALLAAFLLADSYRSVAQGGETEALLALFAFLPLLLFGAVWIFQQRHRHHGI